MVGRKNTVALAAYAVGMTMAAASAPTAAQAQDADAIARIERGLRPAVAIQGVKIDARTLAGEMQRLHVPGLSVAVIRGGKIAWAKGYGVTQAGGAPVTPQTLFQAASISKPITAMGALKMAEAGQFDLDADINSILTSWKLPAGAARRPVSMRQLLSHTAGTTVSGFRGYAAGAQVPTLLQVLEGQAPANNGPVRNETAPGDAWNYSGGGYSVVQQAMVDRSGRPFDALMDETVLKPLGMADSSFAQPLPGALLARAALPHDGAGTAIAGGPHTHPEMAAAGMWTTPTDLAKFALAVQRGAAGADGALSATMTRTMLRPVMNNYALGLEIDGKAPQHAFGHGGRNVGYENSLYAYVQRGDGAVVMTNGDRGGEVAQGLIRAIAAEYRWPTYQTMQRKAIALPAATRAMLAGRYAIKGETAFEIADRAGKLMIALRENQWEPLYAESARRLFVLSRELDLHMAGKGGRLVSGSFQVEVTRVP
ncbi:serine hydrolase domain-containing protein [Telluria aromaticivorans]|uniref:Beta-lactamase family protein n=1 Tax=Telluria aromaticivorans TaxID=2725995 RepID=A0A7Y2JZX8_9BURK|nr:serine hydrolase domain-containing protein [Telluria aromaticivorans]NNG22864.1 beta-lactamase family protein [Telluria aromaticivorans]